MSSVAITGNAAGAGVFTLASPNSASSFTATLPAVTGTLLSNKTPGTVLQVVSTAKTNTFSTSSASPVDITGLSVSITPSSATNKILVMMNIGVVGTQNSAPANFYIVRDSTTIGNGAGATNNISAGVYQSTANNLYDALSFTFLDSPSTTSATTYKIQVSTDTAAIFVGRRVADTYVGGACTITVMEIAA